MKKKRILSMLLALSMSFTLIAGCSKDEGMNNKDVSKEETTGLMENGELYFPELPNNTLAITVSVPNFGTDPQGTAVQELWQKKMEDYLGCKLDITWNMTPWLDYRENEKVLLQTDDIPDVSTYSQGTYVNEFGSDGIVLDILKYSDYLEYYPNFVKETNGGEAYAYNNDGTAYYFMDGFENPENITGAQSFTSFAYRFDILKNNNLVPASTLDEFNKLCEKLQELIDNGTIDANYVMSNSDKNYSFYRGFVGIFHTWDTTYWNGEKWSFGPVEDNFREMLKYLNGLYNKGFIDPEFATDNGDYCTEKAVTGNHLIVPTLWAGMAKMWNTQSTDETQEWGLAYLPENSAYGTPWKWGSRQTGKSLKDSMGVIISSDTEYPEWVVRMIDYQYSDEMIEMMNWGIEGETYTVNNGDHAFTEGILSAEDPVQAAADYGIMSSSACRTGIPFTPLTFEASTEMIPEEPWWNSDDGFYSGKYWFESGKIGGDESVSPYDRPPVLVLSDEEATTKAEFTISCETYAKENSLKFITGELDINDDAAWESYKEGVKSQVIDYDGTLLMLQEKSVLD
ncbi:MAG: hypothetical protein ACK5LT_13335 [Lachnospirales bacterium]